MIILGTNGLLTCMITIIIIVTVMVIIVKIAVVPGIIPAGMNTLMIVIKQRYYTVMTSTCPECPEEATAPLNIPGA